MATTPMDHQTVPKTSKLDIKAQAERMNRLIDDALELLQRIEAGKYIYTDDAPFNIPKFDGARLLSLDPSIRHTMLFPQKLLKNDGSIFSADR